MKLASHNSFTYTKPVGLFSKLFAFTARCQSVNIHKQINLGVRMFDLRIFPKGDSYVVQHGPITFDSSKLKEDLEYLNRVAKLNDIYVRIILEQNTIKKNQAYIDNCFKKFCKEFETKYPNIKFISGRRKCDWKIMYEFKTSEPAITNLYSSTTNLFKCNWLRKIDDLWPWLYAKLKNKKNLAEPYGTEFIMVDFVNINNYE